MRWARSDLRWNHVSTMRCWEGVNSRNEVTGSESGHEFSCRVGLVAVFSQACDVNKRSASPVVRLAVARVLHQSRHVRTSRFFGINRLMEAALVAT